MQQHYFINPFAVNGNVAAIPEGTDSNGYVSYNQGFTFDYQRVLGTDSLAKQIQRQTINQVLLDVTTYLQDIQQYSTSEFIDTTDNGGTAFAYDLGAIVRYSASGTSPFGLYLSLVSSNTQTPGGSQWLNLLTFLNGPSYSVVGAATKQTTPLANGQTLIEITGNVLASYNSGAGTTFTIPFGGFTSAVGASFVCFYGSSPQPFAPSIQANSTTSATIYIPSAGGSGTFGCNFMFKGI